MFFSTMKLQIILVLILLLTNATWSSIKDIETMIKKKQSILLKTQKSNTTLYISLYDEVAKLTISKNNLLSDMGRVEDIDSDKTCDLALKYEEVEFIKTAYYKTPFHDEVAKTLQNMTKLYEQCYPPMAERYLKSIIKIKEHIYMKDSSESAEAHDKLANYYHFSMANFKKAIGEYEEAKNIRKKLYGTDNPRSTKNYGDLAISIYYHGERNKQAEKLLLHSIMVRKNSPSSKKFPLYDAYMKLGIYYSMKGEYTNSIDYLKKALKTFKGKKNSEYIIIISELSYIYLNKNNLKNSLIYAKKAHLEAKKLYTNSKHPQVRESLKHMRDIHKMIKNERINLKLN